MARDLPPMVSLGGRDKSGGDHILVNPELRLKPCLVVIIKITVHHIKFGKGLIEQ